MAIFSGTRVWVYPQSVSGRFQRFHRWSGRILQAILMITPWIYIGGQPLVQIDVPDRHVRVAGFVFGVSDAFMMALLGLLAAFSLFFFTSLFGRAWCGYACPQTVFLEEWIRPIETFIEGERGVRKMRDSKGWTADRALRKAATWASFAAVALLIATSFQSWFAGAHALWTLQAGPVDYSLVGIFTFAWFVDFAWFREQLCTYLCPYARFQSALADDESLVITYDAARAEPRGGKTAKDEGRCIDCNKCVVVCPMGIDIRDGFQLECISCARCVDACEGVMGNLGHPSLVKYTTVAATEGRPTRLLRPRTVVYATLLSVLATGVVAMIARHQPLEVAVERAPGSLYAIDPDGMIRNTYVVRVANNGGDAETFLFTVEGLEGAEVLGGELTLQADESRTVPLIVRAAQGTERTVPFRVRVASDDMAIVQDATFKTPAQE